jgi:hypothetical protein
MANLSFFITPTSITIYDGNRNRIVVYKKATANGKKAEIVPEVSAETKDANTQGVKLANLMVKYLTNKKTKDSYQRVFGRLQKLINSFEVHSFETLYNRLDKAINPKTEATQPAEVLAEVEELETEAV